MKQKQWNKDWNMIEYLLNTNSLTACETYYVCKAITYLSPTIIKKVLKSVAFVSSRFTFASYNYNRPDNAKHIILLSNDIREMNEKNAIGIILHEIGHFVLKHIPTIDNLTIERELEADKFSEKYTKRKVRRIK